MNNTEMKPIVNLLTSPGWEEYSLLDSGDGRKLEQFGPYRLIRPEAEAVWAPKMNIEEWGKASAEFIPSAEENGGHWKITKKVPESWNIRYRGLKFKIMFSNSKHLGIFPEQACQFFPEQMPLAGLAVLVCRDTYLSVCNLMTAIVVIAEGSPVPLMIIIHVLSQRVQRSVIDDDIGFLLRVHKGDVWHIRAVGCQFHDKLVQLIPVIGGWGACHADSDRRFPARERCGRVGGPRVVPFHGKTADHQAVQRFEPGILDVRV